MREVWLSSEDTGAYGRDLGTDLCATASKSMMQMRRGLLMSVYGMCQVIFSILGIQQHSVLPLGGPCLCCHRVIGRGIPMLVFFKVF